MEKTKNIEQKPVVEPVKLKEVELTDLKFPETQKETQNQEKKVCKNKLKQGFSFSGEASEEEVEINF
ncbi:MAG: hypothetical protein J6A28_04330 [Clostridia bacterium]|nr:hypothetical protein [Clostridia bacterium]